MENTSFQTEVTLKKLIDLKENPEEDENILKELEEFLEKRNENKENEGEKGKKMMEEDDKRNVEMLLRQALEALERKRNPNSSKNKSEAKTKFEEKEENTKCSEEIESFELRNIAPTQVLDTSEYHIPPPPLPPPISILSPVNVYNQTNGTHTQNTHKNTLISLIFYFFFNYNYWFFELSL
jgi:hypothetical protein